MMTYYGAKESGIVSPIEMTGEFTDLGVTGEQNVGKTVPMRTRIQVVSNDRHIYEIYATPPGGAEMLADRMVFDRINAPAKAQTMDQMIVRPVGELKFEARPDGSSIAVISGDPATGPSLVLLRFKSGQIPMHWHPSGYYAVVLQGTAKHWADGEQEAACRRYSRAAIGLSRPDWCIPTRASMPAVSA